MEQRQGQDTKLISKFEDLSTPETVTNHTQNTHEQASSKNLFVVMTANQWIDEAKNRPIPKMLFSEFWFEGEICILFADTNLGKSILAVQIGDSISTGEQIKGFKLEALGQSVLYFDFELSDKQFQNRYSIDYVDEYKFSPNFKRVEINPEADIPAKKSFEDYLNDELENEIIRTNTKILIIDNLTYLRNETEQAKNALPLMKHLKALKKKYDLSILVLAHTPKRDLSKPITRNDLAGSKMLINFCDSVFTIGESSSNKNIRYLKQIKARNTEILYDSENVIVCHIEKPINFLKFILVDLGTELDHLKQLTKEDKEKTKIAVLELTDKGVSNVEIGKKLGIHESTVRKYKKQNISLSDY
ncbi:AAA family ATPase [uncultured Lutibacter sp.]|uniref:AAA family ATPase n=1 Tax=uncultured Lutibacter sp. TaxID=437739 RepID=UPI002628F13E|nr:AAA family ATPase [uncultured Lutibacter sp.]